MYMIIDYQCIGNGGNYTHPANLCQYKFIKMK